MVVEIQSQCYVEDLIESLSALSSRQKVSPRTCWVAEDEKTVVAYLLAHPWAGDKPPSLNTVLRKLPQKTNVCFIHDIAVSPLSRGKGVASQLISYALGDARIRGLEHSRLVAVQGVEAFWRCWDYQPYNIPDYTLDGYGADAITMTRKL